MTCSAQRQDIAKYIRLFPHVIILTVTKKCQISLYFNANIHPCVSDRMPTGVRSLVGILYELVDVPSVLSTPQIPKVIREVGCSLFCCSNVSNYSIGETSTYTSIPRRRQLTSSGGVPSGTLPGQVTPVTVYRPVTSHYRNRRDILEYSK